MHRYLEPRKDDSFDREVDTPTEQSSADPIRPRAPGKRTRTLRLAEFLHSRDASPIVRQARERGAPPPIPRQFAPSVSSGLLGMLYRKESGSAPQAETGATMAEQVARAQSSAGRSLPTKLRRRLEIALGADLKDVRIHTGSDSAAAARAVGALAFTVQNRIHFAQGQYDPDSERGQKLIAHEAAHTIQQHGAASPLVSPDAPGDVAVSDPGDRYELEADRFAERFVSPVFARAMNQRERKGGPTANAGDQAHTATGDHGQTSRQMNRQTNPQTSRQVSRQTSPLSPISKSVLARAIIHRQTNPVTVIANSIGTSQDKAKDALTKAGPNRGVVEQAIRQNFNEEDAKKILEAVPAGSGKPPPEVKNKDAKAEKKSGDPPDKGAEGGPKDKGNGKPSKAGPAEPGQGGKVGDGTSPQAGNQGDTIAAGELQLVYQELVEHQAWSQARSTVGEAGSTDRAAFIAQNAGQGAMSGLASGFVMGAATGVVGQLASRYVPIPGVGAIIAGGFAAYGLLTKDWAASFDTIGKFGEGSSDYEVIANTIAAISEIIDIAVNVMNVIAGIIGVISAVMWLISIITVGAASPLAATLSSIALGIVTVTGILDNINNLILQPCVLLFRALHTFTSDADPREVEAQGAGISDAANKAANALGGMAGGKAADAAGAKVKRMRHKAAQKAAGGPDATNVDGPNQATTTGVETPRAAGDGAGAPRTDADGGGAPRTDDGGGAPRADDGSGAPRADDGSGTPRADDGSGAPRTDDGSSAPRTEADAKAKTEQAGQQTQSRWEKFKQNAAQAKENLRKEFADHSARQRQENLDKQRALDEAEAKGRDTRAKELDAEHKGRVDEADRQFDDAVRRGKAEAEVEANNQHRRDLDQAKADRHKTVSEANQTRKREQFEASRERNNAKRARAAELGARQKHIKDQRAELKRQYDEGRANLGDDAPPAAHKALKDQFDTDNRALDGEAAAARAQSRDRANQIEKTYQDKRRSANAKRDAAREAADRAHQGDVERAGRVKETRRRSLEEAAREQAATKRASAHGDAGKYGEGSDWRKGEIDRAGRKGEADVDRDTRGVGRKLWDFFSGKDGRDATKKAWQEARDGTQKGDVTGGPGGIANLIKPTVEGASKWAVGQDRKTEEEKQKEAAEAKKKGFWERNIHPAIYEPGKYWGKGGWKKKFEDGQKTQAGRFTADNQKKAKRERVDPQYKAPPGHPDELAKIEAYVKAAYETKAKAEAAELDAKLKKAKADGDAPQIAKLQAEAKKGEAMNKEHLAAVKVKQQANADQKKRQASAESTMNRYAARSAGITALSGPLAAFKGFTWIGRKLGSESFARMEKDADKLIAAFKNMKLTMQQEQQKQPAKKAHIKAQQKQVDNVADKATKSGSTLKQASSDSDELDATNKKKIAEGSAAMTEASGQKQEYDGKAKTGEQAYADLRGKLVSWAQEHKAARDAAIAKQLGKDPGPVKGSKATIPTSKPKANGPGNNGGGNTGGGNNTAQGQKPDSNNQKPDGNDKKSPQNQKNNDNQKPDSQKSTNKPEQKPADNQNNQKQKQDDQNKKPDQQKKKKPSGQDKPADQKKKP